MIQNNSSNSNDQCTKPHINKYYHHDHDLNIEMIKDCMFILLYITSIILHIIYIMFTVRFTTQSLWTSILKYTWHDWIKMQHESLPETNLEKVALVFLLLLPLFMIKLLELRRNTWMANLFRWYLQKAIRFLEIDTEYKDPNRSFTKRKWNLLSHEQHKALFKDIESKEKDICRFVNGNNDFECMQLSTSFLNELAVLLHDYAIIEAKGSVFIFRILLPIIKQVNPNYISPFQPGADIDCTIHIIRPLPLNIVDNIIDLSETYYAKLHQILLKMMAKKGYINIKGHQYIYDCIEYKNENNISTGVDEIIDEMQNDPDSDVVRYHSRSYIYDNHIIGPANKTYLSFKGPIQMYVNRGILFPRDHPDGGLAAFLLFRYKSVFIDKNEKIKRKYFCEHLDMSINISNTKITIDRNILKKHLLNNCLKIGNVFYPKFQYVMKELHRMAENPRTLARSQTCLDRISKLNNIANLYQEHITKYELKHNVTLNKLKF